eukprot:m.13416 g.13416  ORF g.13416 m.13416 type:complete len:220 (+) comp9721_c0_seq1:132-791(+)
MDEDGMMNANKDTGMSQDRPTVKVVIVPGNGGGDVYDCNWYGKAHEVLSEFAAQQPAPVKVVLKNMPDPHKAREKIWVPFMLNDLGVDSNTIIIGHSSGAVAAMRLAEENPVLGLVLVAACHTDLGMKSERQAGYYSRPWQWEKIKSNCKWIIQYHSPDDCFIDVKEARFVAKHLDSDYFELENLSHFFSYASVLPMLQQVRKKVKEATTTAATSADDD